MGYKTGKARSLDDIKIDDVLRHPIWVWALDEEGIEGQDETWQKPVIDTDDVTMDILYPTITIRIKGTDFYGSAAYDNTKDYINAITIWIENDWIDLKKFKDIPTPLFFISLPKINGLADVEFVSHDIAVDKALRV